MNKALAALIMEATLSFSAPLDLLSERVASLADGEEKRRLKKAVGDVMAVLTSEIVFPIAAKYPELDPDKRQK